VHYTRNIETAHTISQSAERRARPAWLVPLLAALSIALVFIALNYRAYDGFFQDDELDTLGWAPLVSMREYLVAFLKPAFDVSNFRPAGHLYFTLMGRFFGLDFPPWITPVFAIHLVNCALLYLLLRKLAIGTAHALVGVALFALSATAMDAYWKPMYIFDLLCATFCLLSILLFAYRRWILSFVAFWLAYKAKELAVMLPAVLVAYEYWLGQRRFAVLIPFLGASLSFGVQGLLFNPNRDNDYTFRFTLAALAKTVPFYARRLLLLPFSGLALLALVFVPDRRVWFGLTAMLCFLFTLLFLPGRLFEAYAYLPFSCAVIALAAAASRVKPVWLWCALLLWMPLNLRQLRREQRDKLAHDDRIFAFVDQMRSWAVAHPEIGTFVYDGLPTGFQHWGARGAWTVIHRSLGLPVYFRGWPEAAKALENGPVALATWDPATNRLTIRIHSPGT